MSDWLQSIATVSTAGAFGAMALFTFLVTPLAFRSLGRETAGAFARTAMGPYFAAMAVAAVLAAGLLAIAGGFPAEVVVLAVVGFTFIAARRGLLPRMDELRTAREAGDQTADRVFKRLHGMSMVVNLAQMVALAVVALRLGV